jgi:hypothetical protein
MAVPVVSSFYYDPFGPGVLDEITGKYVEFSDTLFAECGKVKRKFEAAGDIAGLERAIGLTVYLTEICYKPSDTLWMVFELEDDRLQQLKNDFLIWRLKSLDYQLYLKSEHWRSRRLLALETAKHRCQLCNSTKRLDVHHRTYARLGNEAPEDLTVLCRRCHMMFHDNARLATD